MKKQYYVYIFGNRRPTLYIGVTNDLVRRIWEHKEGVVDGFTKRYKLGRLLYYEVLDSAEAAIEREKQLKNWHRPWKLALIEETNPEYHDLYEQII